MTTSKQAQYERVAETTAAMSLRELTEGAQQPTLLSGDLYGEFWYYCLSGGFANFCQPIDVQIGNSEDCFGVPVDWSLALWTPNTLRANLHHGNFYAWTMDHLGLGPLQGSISGQFVGSGCLLANDVDFFFLAADGYIN